MVDIAVLFGADRDRANRELKDSIEFEMQLAKVRANWIYFFWSTNLPHVN